MRDTTYSAVAVRRQADGGQSVLPYDRLRRDGKSQRCGTVDHPRLSFNGSLLLSPDKGLEIEFDRDDTVGLEFDDDALTAGAFEVASKDPTADNDGEVRREELL